MVAWTMSLISVHGKTVPIFCTFACNLLWYPIYLRPSLAITASPLLTGRCGHVRWLAVRRLWEYEGRWSRPAKTPREHTLNRMRMLACSKFDLDETSNQSKIGGLPRGQQRTADVSHATHECRSNYESVLTLPRSNVCKPCPWRATWIRQWWRPRWLAGTLEKACGKVLMNQREAGGHWLEKIREGVR